MRGKIVCSTVVAAVGLATFAAPSATADHTDDTFIGAIESEGIPFSTADEAIALAEAVCAYVSAGQPAEQVAGDISGLGNWSEEQSGSFVQAAAQSYCPS